MMGVYPTLSHTALCTSLGTHHLSHVHTAPHPHITLLCPPLMYMSPQLCLDLSRGTPLPEWLLTPTATGTLCRHMLSQQLLTEPAPTCPAHLHTLTPRLNNPCRPSISARSCPYTHPPHTPCQSPCWLLCFPRQRVVPARTGPVGFLRAGGSLSGAGWFGLNFGPRSQETWI